MQKVAKRRLNIGVNFQPPNYLCFSKLPKLGINEPFVKTRDLRKRVKKDFFKELKRKWVKLILKIFTLGALILWPERTLSKQKHLGSILSVILSLGISEQHALNQPITNCYSQCCKFTLIEFNQTRL